MVFLKTKRLLLRNFKDDDLEILYEYRNDPNCYKYQRWSNTSKEYLKNFIEKEKHKIISKNTMQIAISLKNSNKLIGDIYLTFKGKVITLGYTIDPKHQRNGYAYEILKSFIRYLSNGFYEYEIVAMVHPDNKPSRNLLEKLNFNNKGYLEKVGSILYSLNCK